MVRELHDPGHFFVVQFFGYVSACVVVRVQTRMDKQCWHTTTEKWPLVATAKKIRRVVVIAESNVEFRKVGAFNRLTQVSTSTVALDIDGIVVRDSSLSR